MKKKFKLNSNKKVLEYNEHIMFPELGVQVMQQNTRSISFTPEDREKLEKLRAKYKMSRSAIVRMLLRNVEV